MNVDQYQKDIGNNKFFKVLGWFFLIAGIIVFTNIFAFFSWNSRKSNYIKEYVYSEYGTLYYESNGQKVYIQDIYNTNNEKITINIPNNETIKLMKEFTLI